MSFVNTQKEKLKPLILTHIFEVISKIKNNVDFSAIGKSWLENKYKKQHSYLDLNNLIFSYEFVDDYLDIDYGIIVEVLYKDILVWKGIFGSNNKWKTINWTLYHRGNFNHPDFSLTSKQQRFAIFLLSLLDTEIDQITEDFCCYKDSNIPIKWLQKLNYSTDRHFMQYSKPIDLTQIKWQNILI